MPDLNYEYVLMEMSSELPLILEHTEQDHGCAYIIPSKIW
jgi:hypothetical protein